MTYHHDIIEEAKFVDLRFTDTKGKEQHVTVPSHVVDDNFFQNGKMFDGSSIAGWKSINESDMVLMPDIESAVMDPFTLAATAIVRCDVIEPTTGWGYDRDPRTIAKRAELYLQSTGIADTAYFGPEAEFFVFDDVSFDVSMGQSYFKIESKEAAWADMSSHRPRVKGGYFPVPPVDSLQDIRSAMAIAMTNMGLTVEVHHHEVATAGQNEIGTRFASLVRKADELQIFKYVVHQVAHAYGKTATFMPKPLVGDNGTGMHVHQSLERDGVNIFAGDQFAVPTFRGKPPCGVSQEALWYMGGIFKHARAINAFTNSTTNSYKRLVPGFEAPVLLSYSARNRSASIRIPIVFNPKETRLEVRFPDSAGNPYFTFVAMLMAGIDGIQNKIGPGLPFDEDMYDPQLDTSAVDTVSSSLEMSLDALGTDCEFLLADDVFTSDTIDAYIELKREEITRLQMETHPVEFEMYYSA